MPEQYFPDAKFWTLIESSGRQLAHLCLQLEKLSREELVAYQLACWNAKEDVNPFSRFDEMQPRRDACSEDHGDDFASWVLGEGRAFYEAVRDHPTEIQKYLDLFDAPSTPPWNTQVEREEYHGYLSVDLIAKPIFRRKFGDDLDEALDEALDAQYGG